jgi:hypothetical protein
MAIITLNNNSLSSVTALPAGVGGKVLQVVNTTGTTQRSTNNTTFTGPGYSVSITPSSTSSKILIMFSSMGYADTTAQGSIYTLYRNAVNLGDGTVGQFMFRNSGGNLEYGLSAQVFDSPSTTSAITYGIYQRAEGGGAISYFSRSGAPTYLTAMEISA